MISSDRHPSESIKINSEVENYTYAYNCLMDIIMKWSRETNDSMIFIFGDHGHIGVADETSFCSSHVGRSFQPYFGCFVCSYGCC